MKPCVTCGCEKEEGNNDSYCKPCRLERGRENRRKALLAKEGRAPRSKSPKGRSIFCSSCKQPKEEGRENESCCKKCKSDRLKLKRAKAREEKGMRPFKSGRKPECCKCGGPKENPKVGYCDSCNAQKERERRLVKVQSAEFRRQERAKIQERIKNDPNFKFKKMVRATTNRYIKAGFLIRKPCEICGKEKTDAHHDDYWQPLKVRWLCRKHHNEHHRQEILNEEI